MDKNQDIIDEWKKGSFVFLLCVIDSIV